MQSTPVPGPADAIVRSGNPAFPRCGTLLARLAHGRAWSSGRSSPLVTGPLLASIGMVAVGLSSVARAAMDVAEDRGRCR